MYQAIEAVCRAGQIVPLEPVHFEENEHLVIVRLPVAALGSTAVPAAAPDWQTFVGALQGSTNWQGDPQTVQEGMRREWD
jgi:hypothetical protein